MEFLNKYRAFKAGQLTQKETEEFVAWMNTKEGEEKILGEIEDDWNYLDAKEATDETRLESIFTKIKAETNEERTLDSRTNYFSGIAAAIALIIVFAGLTYLIFPEIQTLNQTQRIVKSNPSGQKSTHFLPDGSKVFLNAESSISYVADFEGEVREIELSGEAYFEVAKNPKKPFIVQSGLLSTTAVGTAFNVRAYENEDILEVALTEGKVKIASLGLTKEYFLEPGDKLAYSIESKEMNQSSFDLEEEIGWKNGVIKFQNADFIEVKSRLERWFGVQIKSKANPADNWTYTGTFENQSLVMILEGMKLTKNFDYHMEQKTVEIMFK